MQEPAQSIIDLGPGQPFDAATDLWLRDGDVIEVPEKGEAFAPVAPRAKPAAAAPSATKEGWQRRADSPLAGRNFENFSEDPFLAGRIAAAYVRGVQAHRVGACSCLVAGNDCETRRHLPARTWMSGRCAKCTCSPPSCRFATPGSGR
jgi:hypothetical protein